MYSTSSRQAAQVKECCIKFASDEETPFIVPGDKLLLKKLRVSVDVES